MQLETDISPELRAPAEAAVAWINNTQQSAYELTGLVNDVDSHDAVDGFERGVLLCDGEICAREQVRVQRKGTDYQFELVEAQARDIPPLLDPPAGLRRSWLDAQLEKYEFVVLLFYRGLW